jgi:hypothetical protein
MAADKDKEKKKRKEYTRYLSKRETTFPIVGPNFEIQNRNSWRRFPNPLNPFDLLLKSDSIGSDFSTLQCNKNGFSFAYVNRLYLKIEFNRMMLLCDT